MNQFVIDRTALASLLGNSKSDSDEAGVEKTDSSFDFTDCGVLHCTASGNTSVRPTPTGDPTKTGSGAVLSSGRCSQNAFDPTGVSVSKAAASSNSSTASVTISGTLSSSKSSAASSSSKRFASAETASAKRKSSASERRICSELATGAMATGTETTSDATTAGAFLALNIASISSAISCSIVLVSAATAETETETGFELFSSAIIALTSNFSVSTFVAAVPKGGPFTALGAVSDAIFILNRRRLSGGGITISWYLSNNPMTSAVHCCETTAGVCAANNELTSARSAVETATLGATAGVGATGGRATAATGGAATTGTGTTDAAGATTGTGKDTGFGTAGATGATGVTLTGDGGGKMMSIAGTTSAGAGAAGTTLLVTDITGGASVGGGGGAGWPMDASMACSSFREDSLSRDAASSLAASTAQFSYETLWCSPETTCGDKLSPMLPWPPDVGGLLTRATTARLPALAGPATRTAPEGFGTAALGLGRTG